MSVIQYVFALTGIALLIFGVYALANRLKEPIRFTSLDELRCVGGVAIWAQQQIDRSDPRADAIGFLSVYLGRLQPTFIVRISVAELEALAPFIDEFIAGKGPAWNLPAEYEDWRPAVLREFKSRMTAEGFWPKRDNVLNAPAH
jgi:hypothetical protein